VSGQLDLDLALDVRASEFDRDGVTRKGELRGFADGASDTDVSERVDVGPCASDTSI
jgi:hypothetical protein